MLFWVSTFLLYYLNLMNYMLIYVLIMHVGNRHTFSCVITTIRITLAKLICWIRVIFSVRTMFYLPFSSSCTRPNPLQWRYFPSSSFPVPGAPPLLWGRTQRAAVSALVPSFQRRALRGSRPRALPFKSKLRMCF